MMMMSYSKIIATLIIQSGNPKECLISKVNVYYHKQQKEKLYKGYFSCCNLI